MKNLKNLKGAKVLSNSEMKELNGGKFACSCNGIYVGDADSAMGCVKLCGWGVALEHHE